MNRFQVGDRVKCIAAGVADTAHVGQCGTVREVYDERNIGVEFDDFIYDENGYQVGHRLDRSLAEEKGWYCHPDELEVVVDEMPCPVEDLL